MNSARRRYSRKTIKNVQLIHVLAGIAWVYIVFSLKMNKNDLISKFLLFIPIIVYYINFTNAPKGTVNQEILQYRGDYLAFASITMLVLIHWAKVEGSEKNELYKIILTAFILLMISLIHVWPSSENNSLYLHTRSDLQTAGLVMLSFALYKYYDKTTDQTKVDSDTEIDSAILASI